MKKLKRFGLRIEPELKERLEAIAKQNGKPVSEVIREVLWNLVKNTDNE